MRSRILGAFLVSFLLAGGAFASWYDDYDAGLAALRKGNFQLAIQKMTAAINANPKEDNHARSYGAIFINYHPYYYRGVAYLNSGKYEQAVKDLDTATGPGELDQGPLETLLQRAKSKLEANNTPEPQPPAPQPPTPQPPTPQPRLPQPVPVPVPSTPSLDPGLRQRVAGEISSARSHMTAAQQRNASGSKEFSKATQLLAEANTRSATARSNDDLNAALASAQNASTYFDAAAAPAVVATTTRNPTKPDKATDVVLGNTKARLHNALDNYFRGEFEDATKDLEKLSGEMPKNGWVWAFLGASQYSQYAFEADEKYKASALESFKKAKTYGKFGNGLPGRYFSKRIQKAFASAG
jgi:tetratricopeptide (TPR) repeat protein